VDYYEFENEAKDIIFMDDDRDTLQKINKANNQKQEGHDGPESLTRNNCFFSVGNYFSKELAERQVQLFRQVQLNFNLPL
jgi:hypothetical protein